MTSITDPWGVFDYEVKMFQTLEVERNTNLAGYRGAVHNAIVESMVLHTRILCDILLSKGKEPDDINLVPTLLPTFSSPAVGALRAAYGSRNQQRSPCWEFNKMMAHPTSHRGDSYDYGPTLSNLVPLINAVLIAVYEQRGDGKTS